MRKSLVLCPREIPIQTPAKLQFMVLALRHSGTPRLRDSGTPALPDSETPGLPGSLRGSEAPGGHLMNMNVNFANNVEK